MNHQQIGLLERDSLYACHQDLSIDNDLSLLMKSSE